MRKAFLVFLLLVGLGLFGWLLFKLPWHDAIVVLTQAKLEYVAVYAGTSILIKLLLSWRWQVIVKAKEIKLPFWNSVAYRFASSAVSFITPGPRVGGDAVAAAMLRKHGTKRKPISFAKALSTVLLDRSVEVQTFAALFFVGVLLLAIAGDIPSSVRLLLLGGSTLLLVIIGAFAINILYGRPILTALVSKLSKNPEFQENVHHFETMIVTFYRKDRKEFLISHIISALAWLTSLVEYKYLLMMLGIPEPPLYAIFIIFSFVGLAYIIPIPLALGSLEGLQAAAFRIVNYDPVIGIVLALVTRLRDVVFTIFGFMVLVYYGFTPGSLQKTVR